MEKLARETPIQLCVTHSPLVTRVFQAAMRHQNIPGSAIRSIARRGVPFQGKGVCLNDVSDEMEQCFRKRDRSGFSALRKRFENALHSLTEGRPFEAYIPHANRILYQEIIRHPECFGYSFLEEGFTSMAWDSWPKARARSTWAMVFRNHLKTLWVGPRYRFNRPMFEHSLPNYRGAYAISKHAFCGMPGRADVSSYIPPMPLGDGIGDTYVILDSVYLHLKIPWEFYENAIVEAALTHSLPCSELRIKFHFADARAQQRFAKIRERLGEAGLSSVYLLGSDFTVEENLTSDDLLLFAVTSLGYYSALAGARVKCFAESIDGLALHTLILNGALPEDFLQVIGLPESSSSSRS